MGIKTKRISMATDLAATRDQAQHLVNVLADTQSKRLAAEKEIDELKKRLVSLSTYANERDAFATAIIEQPVRVLRLIEYTGPRDWVEACVKRAVHGTHHLGTDKAITGITLTEYPDKLELARKVTHTPAPDAREMNESPSGFNYK